MMHPRKNRSEHYTGSLDTMHADGGSNRRRKALLLDSGSASELSADPRQPDDDAFEVGPTEELSLR